MTPRLKGQNCKFFTTPLSRNSQKRLELKENQTKNRKMTASLGVMVEMWAICNRPVIKTNDGLEGREWNLKKVLSWKFDKFNLFTHFLFGRHLKNLKKHAVLIFFRLSWQFKWEKSYFGKHLFSKQLTDNAYKTTGKNFSFNQCLKQKILLLFFGKLFYKSNRKHF